MKFIFSITLIIISFQSLPGQSLGRRASWEANIGWPNGINPGAMINSIQKGSVFEKTGVKAGDLIIQVNDRKILNQEDWSHVTYSIRAHDKTIIHLKRGNGWIKKEIILKPLEQEKHEGINTFYESVVSDYGIRQRTIITTPNSDRKLPAIFLIQGLSCSTIEQYSGRSNNWVKLINDLVEKSGMVVMRVDKPGVGDSEGDCGCTDFKTELSGYEAAIKSLKSKTYVDTTRIVVYGNSMGSALAPYFANTFNLAGSISDGTFYKTWYEHMLEIERRILAIEGDSETTIVEKMNKYYIPLYHEMLIKKKSFEDILDEQPALKEHHRQGLNHMYGRSMEYYHQVQDFNFAQEWEEIKVPVRIRWGTNDWIMSEFDNEMIMDVLERKGHKDHELYKYPNLDHWSTIHPSYSESFNFKPGKWEDYISLQIIDWAKEIVDKK
ncbi:alpha/beta hydrolase family protein [Ekhidna sp.]